MQTFIFANILLTAFFHTTQVFSSSFPFASYSAIGDSYSAGLGSGSLLQTCYPSQNCNPSCLRSAGAYGYLLSQAYQPASFQFSACSGANTSACTNTQIQPTSPSSSSITFGSPDLVTLTIGGNDNNAFTSIVYNCVYIRNITLLRTTSCDSALAVAASTLASPDFRTDLQTTIHAAQTTNLLPNQNRTVIVLGYARFYNTDTPSTACELDVDYPSSGPGGIREQINANAIAINAILQATATALGATYVDVDARFEGHRFCEGNGQTPWFVNSPLEGGLATIVEDIEAGLGDVPGGFLDGYGLQDLAEDSFHPTNEGQMAYLGALEAALGLGLSGRSMRRGSRGD